MATLKIRDEHFDFAPRYTRANGLDGELEQLRAAVFAIVAIDAGNNRIAQAHDRDRFGDPTRLVVIDRQRSALLNGAEPAPARTDIPEDHEGSGAVIPALAHVGTGGALADRMQLEIRDEFFEFTVVLTHWSGRAKPFGPLGRLRADC